MEVENGISNKLKDYFSFRLERNTLLIILISSIGFFIWFYGFALFGPIQLEYLNNLNTLTIEKGRVMQFFLVFMSISSVVSGIVINRTSKKQIFLRIAAILASVLTMSLNWISDFTLILPISAMLGISAGLYLVALGTSFSDYVSPEDRGRIMGLIIACSIPLGYLFLIMNEFLANSYQIIGVSCLLFSTLLVALLKPKDVEISERDARRNRGMGTKQSLLYSIPFFLFYLVVGVLLSIVFPTIQNNVSPSTFYLYFSIPLIIASLFGGNMLDMSGRKFPLIVGLAFTGISLAILGVVDINYSYLTIIPLAIGFSIVTSSSFIIWGDLAPMKGRGTYYGLGIGLLALAVLIGLTTTGTVFGNVSEGRMKSYLFYSAVSLFLCIPPIIAADDALPKEVIEKRQLEEHLRKAQERIKK